MKHAVLVLFAGMLMSLVAFAQDTMKPDDKKQDSTKSEKMSKKTLNVMGRISDDGKTFMDKEGKNWSISNPDAVKGHEGHQVTVKGHVDADKNEIHVISLKMAKDTGKKDDMHQ